MKLCHSGYEKVYIQTDTYLAVWRKHEERGRPSKGLWANLDGSYKESPHSSKHLT